MNYATRKQKNPNYANRGMAWESIIEYCINNYKNEAAVCKIPTHFIPIRNAYGKIINVKVEEKSTVDYIGRYKSIPVAFEAKNTNTHRINFGEVKAHQGAFLDKWMNAGAAAFIVVAFDRLDKFYRIPWSAWRLGQELWKEGKKAKKTIIFDDGTKWTTPGMASISPDDLPPEWEIQSDNIYKLPFLQNVERNCTERFSVGD